jgi:hypothetical protein
MRKDDEENTVRGIFKNPRYIVGFGGLGRFDRCAKTTRKKRNAAFSKIRATLSDLVDLLSKPTKRWNSVKAIYQVLSLLKKSKMGH